jgi:hypothetical protein
VPISSTNTSLSASIPASLATSVLQAALKNSSRSLAPTDLFSAPPHPLEHPRNGRLAHAYPRNPLQVLAPRGERGSRTLLHVGLQEPPGTPVHLWAGAGTFLRGERFSLIGHPRVSLNRGEAHPEIAGGLALARSSTQGLDYLLAQVFGVGVHGPMMSDGSSTLQAALEEAFSEAQIRQRAYPALAGGECAARCVRPPPNCIENVWRYINRLDGGYTEPSKGE